MSKNIKIMRIKEVIDTLSISKSSIYREIAKGNIKPFYITGRTVGFLESDIQDFIDKKAGINKCSGECNE